MDYFTNHTCGECVDYSCGGCSEKCMPREANDIACSRLRLRSNPAKEGAPSK